MKSKVFISFSADDISLVKRLKIRIDKSPYLSATVITDIRDAQKHNTDKVAAGINECFYFVPIITEKSINNQWVNQEIGFASALKKQFFPIIQFGLLDRLKGFVNKERDQPYQFKITGIEKSDRKYFRDCVNKLIEDIENKLKPLIVSEASQEELMSLRDGQMLLYNKDNIHLELNGVIHSFGDRESYEKVKKILKNKVNKRVNIDYFNNATKGRDLKFS